jgi:hypothetical protein
MAVTAIKLITNRNLTQIYIVMNRENPWDTGGPSGLKIALGTDLRCNTWIPWCDSQKDWALFHSIRIFTGRNDIFPIFNIWQQGNYIRYSKDDQFYDSGDIVPGNSSIGRDCTVEITGNTFADADLRFS